MKDILTEIQALFSNRLQSKTGWGKNEVLELYNQCVIEVLASKFQLYNAFIMTRKYYEKRLEELYNLKDEVEHVVDMDHIQKSIFLSDIEWDILCILDELERLKTKKKRMETLIVFSMGIIAVLALLILIIKLIK